MPIKSQVGLARHIGVSKQRINTLIKNGKLVLNDKKKIDTEDPINKDFIEAMIANRTIDSRDKTNNQSKDLGNNQSFVTPVPSGKKAQADLALQVQKIKQAEKQIKLMDIRLATARKELISSNIVTHVITTTFGTLFDLLVKQYPQNAADELIDIINKGGDNARGLLIEKITGDLRRQIEDTVDHSEAAITNEFSKMETIK